MDEDASSASERSHNTRDSSNKAYSSLDFLGGEADENPGAYNDFEDDQNVEKTEEDLEKEKKIVHDVVHLDLDFLEHQRRDIWCFEPKGVAQRATVFLQNTFETWMIVGIVIIALLNPSFISCFFVLLSSNLIYLATYSPKTRLYWGSIMLYLDFVVLICVVCFKATYLQNNGGEKGAKKGVRSMSYANHDAYQRGIKFYESFGFSIGSAATSQSDGWLQANDKSEEWLKADPDLNVDLNVYASFIFEFALMCVYLLGVSQYRQLTRKIDTLERDFIKVAMVKIFESRADDEEDSDNEGEGTLGTVDVTTIADGNKEQRKKDYKKQMQAKGKELQRVYLDCQGFTKRNKLYFPLLILIQLLQSMVFNGVLDVPFLLMILFIGAMYAFRKSYFLLFQYMVIFVASYINLTAMLKFTYLISTKVEFIKTWFIQN